ncbi:MAG: DUF5791 family protein [Halolamina sp.]
MLHDAIESPAEASPADFRTRYEAELASVVAARGVDAVAAETDLDRDTVESIADGDTPELTLSEAASVLGTDDDRPDAEAITAETRDHLMLGMTTGILDVDTVAADIGIDLTGKEVQQALEGRTPVTLGQLAEIQAYIESQQRP